MLASGEEYPFPRPCSLKHAYRSFLGKTLRDGKGKSHLTKVVSGPAINGHSTVSPYAEIPSSSDTHRPCGVLPW